MTCFGPYTKIAIGTTVSLASRAGKEWAYRPACESAHLANTEKYERPVRSYSIEEGCKRFHSSDGYHLDPGDIAYFLPQSISTGFLTH